MTPDQREVLASRARDLRQRIEPGDTMQPLWEVIFDLECLARGEEPLIKDKSFEWWLDFAR